MKISVRMFKLVLFIGFAVLFALLQYGRWTALAFFVGGLGLGTLALWLDEYVFFKYYNDTQPDLTQTNTSSSITKPFLISRSLLFLIILVPLSVFVVSSTGNTIGQGFVLALLLELWVEMIVLREDLVGFNLRFAQQAKKPFSFREQQGVIVVYSLVLAVLASVILI